jgi:tight adherence protein B
VTAAAVPALVAVALLLVPRAPAPVRARMLRGAVRRAAPRRFRPPRPGGALAGLAAGLLLGPAGGLAGALVGTVVWRGWRRRAADRARLAATSAVAAGLGALVAELRAGAHPVTAARGAAQDAQFPAGEVFDAIASTAELGGEVDAALADLAARRPALRTALGGIARAWTLSAHHGVPLADVLDAVRHDLDRRVAFAGRVHARMAGPRASAAVLAGLPPLGVLLGEIGGAAPLRVLSSTTAGQVLLVLGALLVCAGLLWSARLTDRAVPS